MSFPTVAELTDLYSRVQEMHQEAPGYLMSVSRNVEITNPAYRDRVQTEVDEMVGLYFVLHSIKMFETYWSRGDWGDQKTDIAGELITAMDPDDLTRMLAYRHIRHVAGHGMDGSRTDESGKPLTTHLTEFETVMQSAVPLPGVSCTADRITVSPPVFSPMRQLMLRAAGRGMSYAASAT